ncbi:hypothetical protein LTS10_011302 [Elasticomyces elasticus]|nr:hypothetical protein LTS10_011302 [Elasticomyces elasticus]
MCGSQFVNEEFLQHLRVQAVREVGPGGFEELCTEHLGITTAAGISEAGDHIEGIKSKFSSVKADASHIIVHGAQGAKRASWEVRIQSAQIAGFFEPVIQKIFGCIDRQMTAQTKGLIIPGGFGRSRYFVNRVKERYPDLMVLGQSFDSVGSYQPIARGALYRYSDIQQRGLPSTEAFGIAQVEVYDPKIHPDAVKRLPDTTARSRRKSTHNTDIVEKDPFDKKVLIVHDRWTSILEKGTMKLPGKPIACERWQQYYAYADQKEISQTVYWTESDIEEHASILERGMGILTAGAKLRADIKPWDELIFKLDDLKELGFKLEKTSSGPAYKIWYRLKVTCDGANVDINFQIARPGSSLYDGEDFNPGRVFMTAEDVHEIVAASHNPIPRTATN